VVESFFATLKRELVHRRQYSSRKEAKADLFAYIEVWYNRKRRHSAIGYISPAEFERRAAVNPAANANSISAIAA
jgi:putative transposase